MTNLRHLLLIDTEFVSSKRGGQPFQVGFIEYEIKDGKYIRVGEFNLQIKLRKGLKLNTYAKECTGIDEETLEKHGFPFDNARYEVMNYLAKFPIDETLIIGWDPQGDKKMMNNLLNYKEELFDINEFKWHDVMKVYKRYYTELSNNNPSLTSACAHFNFDASNAHDALTDAELTGKILFKMIEDLGEETALPVLQYT